MPLLDAWLLAGRGHCSVGSCMEDVLPVSPSLSLLIRYHAEEGTPAPSSVSSTFCSLYFTICFIQTLLSQTNCRVTCNTRGCQVSSTFKPFFPFSSSFLAIIKLLTSQHLHDCKSNRLFSFSLSSIAPKREACSGCAASSGSWRRQHWDFLPVSLGRARSSHCCIPRLWLRHSVGFKEPSSSPTAQLFLLSALHFYMEKTKALHPISGYLSHIQELVCLGFPLGIE